MIWIIILFWVLISLVVYTYAGYGLLVWIILKIQRIFTKKKIKIDTYIQLPSVAMIIPAYNEEQVLRQKIVNSLETEYPASRFRVVVISDGSDDDTSAIVSEFPDVIHLHLPERKGKAAAMNRAAEYCTTDEIFVFTDANTLVNPDAVQLLVNHYEDNKVGGVSGEKKVIAIDEQSSEGESTYWKYESFLKKIDSAFYSIVGAAGELLSVRAGLYRPLEEDTILDDFILSLDICKQGYVIRYEPAAIASELPSPDIKEEEKRKKRIGAGAFQGMNRMLPLLNIFKYGKLSFQYISRRVLRWAVCPPALPLIFFLNVLIVVVFKRVPFFNLYVVLLWGQSGFYLLAFLGWQMSIYKMRKINLFFIPYYFLFMNFSVWAGLYRYLRGTQSALWEKSERTHRRFTSVDRKNT